jgi:class 3 adenylate cyclase
MEETLYLYLKTWEDRGRLRALAIDQPYPVIYVSSDTERGTIQAYATLQNDEGSGNVLARDVNTLWGVDPVTQEDEARYQRLKNLCVGVDDRLGITEVKIGHLKPNYIPALLMAATADSREADVIETFLDQGANVLSLGVMHFLQSQARHIRLGKSSFTLYLNSSNDVIKELRKRLDEQPQNEKELRPILHEIILTAALPLFEDPGLTERLMSNRIANTFALFKAQEDLVEERKGNTILSATLKERLDPNNAVDLSRIPKTAERRDCAVLILDLVKSTWMLGNVDVSEGGEIFEKFVEAVAKTIRESGGHFDKFTGDGVLAEFFADSNDDSARKKAVQVAVECAKQLTDVIETFFNKGMGRKILDDAGLIGPKTRAALAWGPVNFGRYGGSGTAVGRSMVVAARLCGNKPFFEGDQGKQRARVIGTEPIYELSGLRAGEAGDRLIEKNWPIEGLAPVTVFRLYP